MKLFASERRQQIMELLKEKKRITVKELAVEIDVSEATLRTDLNKMEQDGLLTRTHGGAVINDQNDNDTSFSARERKNRKEKAIIAEKAFELIAEQQCILLDASSTALELARYLKNKPIRLTVVTTGLHTALELKDNPDITIILIGGVVTKGSTSIEGTLGINVLDHVNIDIMFTSGNGFSIHNGITDFNLYEVEMKKEIIRRSQKVVALIDSSKIGKTSSSFYASLEDIDTFITDQPLSEEMAQALLEKEIEIIAPVTV